MSSATSHSRFLDLPQLVLDENGNELAFIRITNDAPLAYVSEEVLHLLHTRSSLDDLQKPDQPNIPSWRPVTGQMMPNEVLCKYAAKRALATGHVNDPLDHYTSRVADAIMPELDKEADAGKRPRRSREEMLPAIYDYMIWPGRYDSHRHWAYRNIEAHLPVSIASCAALFGLSDYSLNLIRKASEDNVMFGRRYDNVLLNAALGGHFELFKELHALGVHPQRHLDPDTLSCAAWAGNMEIINFLLENDLDYRNDMDRAGHDERRVIEIAAQWAAKAGHKHVVKMLYDKLCDMLRKSSTNLDSSFFWGRVLASATRWDHIELVKLVLEEDPHPTPSSRPFMRVDDVSLPLSTLAIAAEFGRTEIIELLYANGTYPSPMQPVDDAIQRAARHGHIVTVKTLIRLGVPYDWKTMDASPISWVIAAAEAGEHEVVKMFLDSGFDAMNKGVQAAQIAAKNGYVTVVKLFFDAGVDPYAVMPAIEQHRQWHLKTAVEEYITNVPSVCPRVAIQPRSRFSSWMKSMA